MHTYIIYMYRRLSVVHVIFINSSPFRYWVKEPYMHRMYTLSLPQRDITIVYTVSIQIQCHRYTVTPINIHTDGVTHTNMNTVTRKHTKVHRRTERRTHTDAHIQIDTDRQRDRHSYICSKPDTCKQCMPQLKPF